MGDPHPIDALRFQVVAARAALRAARQDLARKKRAVARTAVLTKRTAKEREAELDLLVYAHPEVIELEDAVLKLQHEEDRAVARFEAELRGAAEQQWFVRERMADALAEFAAALTTTPYGHLAVAVASSLRDDPVLVGESEYLKERQVQ